MNKKIKATFGISIALFIWWAVLFFGHTKEQPINYWWQAALAVAAIIFGLFGMHSAKKWGWLKSGVGQGVFFISLGLILWGIGQAGWTYYVIKYPGEEVPTATILDILYFSTIPLWTIGILRLSKATGAKYALKSVWGKILAVVISAIMFAISYYFLVIVARGGNEYFQQPFIDTFWDLGYAVGDAINLTLALVIFGLSWKLLGGKFRKPILVILAAFGVTYLADFAFSYYDGLGLYYNGDKSDLLYLLMLTTFAIGLSMLDPSRKSKNLAKSTEPAPALTSPNNNVAPAISAEQAVPLAAAATAVPESVLSVSQTVEQAVPTEPATPPAGLMQTVAPTVQEQLTQIPEPSVALPAVDSIIAPTNSVPEPTESAAALEALVSFKPQSETAQPNTPVSETAETYQLPTEHAELPQAPSNQNNMEQK